MVGSMERLFGHLIEVHAGAFPAWYAPVQLAVLPVGGDDAAASFADSAEVEGLRVELHRDGSLAARVREVRRVPFVAVVGAREAASGTVSLRPRGGRPEELPVAEALARIRASARP